MMTTMRRWFCSLLFAVGGVAAEMRLPLGTFCPLPPVAVAPHRRR